MSFCSFLGIDRHLNYLEKPQIPKKPSHLHQTQQIQEDEYQKSMPNSNNFCTIRNVKTLSNHQPSEQMKKYEVNRRN